MTETPRRSRRRRCRCRCRSRRRRCRPAVPWPFGVAHAGSSRRGWRCRRRACVEVGMDASTPVSRTATTAGCGGVDARLAGSASSRATVAESGARDRVHPAAGIAASSVTPAAMAAVCSAAAVPATNVTMYGMATGAAVGAGVAGDSLGASVGVDDGCSVGVSGPRLTSRRRSGPSGRADGSGGSGRLGSTGWLGASVGSLDASVVGCADGSAETRPTGSTKARTPMLRPAPALCPARMRSGGDSKDRPRAARARGHSRGTP